MDKKERLSVAIRYLKGLGKISIQQDIADKMGMNKGTVSSALNGNEKYLTNRFLERFNYTFGELFNKQWLLTGEGNMLKDENTNLNSIFTVGDSNKTQIGDSTIITHSDNTSENNNNDSRTISRSNITYLLPMSAMGGSLTGFSETGTTLQNCESIVSPIDNVDFAITVYGESMAPEYPSGSRILIKKINPDIFIDWGRVYVLDTSNGVVVKEVHESEKEGYISCFSINPDPKFKPFDIPMDEVYGMYRVLMCMSSK